MFAMDGQDSIQAVNILLMTDLQFGTWQIYSFVDNKHRASCMADLQFDAVEANLLPCPFFKLTYRCTIP